MNLHQEIHWTKKETLGLFVFLLIVGIGAILYFFFFQNAFSKEDIILKISGPQEITSGKEISWIVNIKNQSNVSIENLNLTFEYPSGVFTKDGKIKKREERIIKILPKGKEKSESFSGIIFGTKEEVKEAKAFLIYNPKGLSTQFKNQTSFSTRISETSVLFSMNCPTEINPEEEFPISFTWQSGFPFPLQNVQVRLFLPEGFEKVSEETENEKTTENSLVFDLGSLNENEAGKREIKGKVKGEVGEEKLFRAEFGIFDERLYEFIPLSSVQKILKITTSTLDVFRKVNGEYNYAASPGEKLNYIIEFVNTGDNYYKNLNLKVELESNVLDFSTLKAIPGGMVEGKTVTFSYKNFPKLLSLGPYEKDMVGFEVKVKSDFSKENAVIKEKITFGTIEKQFQTKISSKVSFDEKIYSDLESLPDQAKDVFDFGNSDSVLEVGRERLFVVGFKIENKGNKLKNVKIETSLPEGVSFEEKLFPQSVKYNFDQEKKTLVLDIGTISSNFSKEYLIQLKIIPTELPQEIIKKVKLTATDNWTEKTFEIERSLKDTYSLQ